MEEGITDTDNQGEFACTGGIEVAGVRIKCWRYYRPHGAESLRQALMNSCNPVFIGLGQKMGVKTYYSYLRKFKLLEKTGIDIPGEAGSIFLAENKVGPVELATISFGQRFEITPIQLISAVSAIANGGTSIKPRLVKQIVNSQTEERKELEVEKKHTVISKETSEKVLSMMESVVSEGTGKNAKVEGFRIGGKTGTSEDGVNTGKYVTSFCGVAPIDIEVKQGEQVISEETAKKVLSMMESVVSEGTGKNARVSGYSIGGKTGTSEDGVNTGKYVTSFVGVADIPDPEVAIIIILYNPTGEGGHQGGAWVVLTTHTV